MEKQVKTLRVVFLQELISVGRLKKMQPNRIDKLYVPIYFAICNLNKTSCEVMQIDDLLTSHMLDIDSIGYVLISDAFDVDLQYTISFDEFIENYIEQEYDGNIKRYNFSNNAMIKLYTNYGNHLVYAINMLE